MKKIIAAFDGLKYSYSTRGHAIALAQLTGAHLAGIFKEDRSYSVNDEIIKYDPGK